MFPEFSPTRTKPLSLLIINPYSYRNSFHLTDLKTRQSLLNLKLSLRKTGPLVNFVPSWNVYLLFAKNIVQFQDDDVPHGTNRYQSTEVCRIFHSLEVSRRCLRSLKLSSSESRHLSKSVTSEFLNVARTK